jgi:hypothetical protein
MEARMDGVPFHNHESVLVMPAASVCRFMVQTLKRTCFKVRKLRLLRHQHPILPEPVCPSVLPSLVNPAPSNCNTLLLYVHTCRSTGGPAHLHCHGAFPRPEPPHHQKKPTRASIVTVSKTIGRTRNRTGITGIRIRCANHYTIQP